MQRVFITGVAGFIGFHLATRLLSEGKEVVGLDNFNSYYDSALKRGRTKLLTCSPGFRLIEMDLNSERLAGELSRAECHTIVHLAAQAGVRYSIENPSAYIESNVDGTLSLLQAARALQSPHFIFASSSSVYGNRTTVPFRTCDMTDRPESVYAATKKMTEHLAYVYSHLYGLRCTGLRFFTVYGPWGRPDMAYFKFSEAMTRGESIDLYNKGDMRRDFTYVDDVVDAVSRIIARGSTLSRGWEIFNIGNNHPEPLSYLVSCLETALGVKANTRLLPMQPGDVWQTYADIEATRQELGFEPKVGLQEGINKFAKWYLAWKRSNV